MEYFENQQKIEIPVKYKFVIRYYHKSKHTHLYISSALKYDDKEIALRAGNMKLTDLRKADENIGKAKVRVEQGQISKKEVVKKLSLAALKENEKFISQWGIIRNVKKYSIEEVLSQYNEEDNLINFDGDLIPMGSDRYQNFVEHGIICTCCGFEGQYFYKERFVNDQGYHFNLYGIDKNGNEIQMTKDHIVPKSKGGANHIDNYQPFCEPCNKRKKSIDNDKFMNENSNKKNSNKENKQESLISLKENKNIEPKENITVFQYKIIYIGEDNLQHELVSKKNYKHARFARQAGLNKVKELKKIMPNFKQYELKFPQLIMSKEEYSKLNAIATMTSGETYEPRWAIIRKGRKYSIEEVLSKYNKENEKVDFDGDLIPMGSSRYANFKFHGIVCQCCGLTGQYFRKGRFASSFGYHFNLYGIDKNGKEVLMTKDHFKAKSKGGKNNIDNYQTLCEPCNVKKGSMENDEFMAKYKII